MRWQHKNQNHRKDFPCSNGISNWNVLYQPAMLIFQEHAVYILFIFTQIFFASSFCADELLRRYVEERVSAIMPVFC
jgi:hypothetical protein